ncbi:MAG: hypothetical protein BGO16_14770 [Nitrobacter sp. 62-23]|nr:MAG: hypothetical protein BGO16_14770 [Nitrobacter sp. 62-23]
MAAPSSQGGSDSRPREVPGYEEAAGSGGFFVVGEMPRPQRETAAALLDIGSSLCYTNPVPQGSFDGSGD